MIGKTGIDIVLSQRGTRAECEKSGQGALRGILCVKEKTLLQKKIIQNSVWLAVAQIAKYTWASKGLILDFRGGGGGTQYIGEFWTSYFSIYVHKV